MSNTKLAGIAIAVIMTTMVLGIAAGVAARSAITELPIKLLQHMV